VVGFVLALGIDTRDATRSTYCSYSLLLHRTPFVTVQPHLFAVCYTRAHNYVQGRSNSPNRII